MGHPSNSHSKNNRYTLFGALTDPGRAHQADRHNEDALWVPKTIADASLAANGALYIVADGIGGHDNGEVASQLAIATISATYYQNPDPDRRQALYQAILAANTSIYQRTPGIDGSAANHMGSTVVAVVIKAGQLIVANLGDSRAYVVRGKQAHVISEDHTLVAEMLRRQLLSPEEAAAHPDRSTLTRSLGQETTCQPFISNWLVLQPTDRVVLCTDGLWDVIGDAQLARLASQGALQAAAQALINAANARGGPDNVTAIVIGNSAYAGAGLLAPLMALPPLWLAGGAGVVALAVIFLLIFLTLGSNGPTPKPATIVKTVVTSGTPAPAKTTSPAQLVATPALASPVTATLAPTVTNVSLTPAPVCGELGECLRLDAVNQDVYLFVREDDQSMGPGFCSIPSGTSVAVLEDQITNTVGTLMYVKAKVVRNKLTAAPASIEPCSDAQVALYEIRKACDDETCEGYIIENAVPTPAPAATPQ